MCGVSQSVTYSTLSGTDYLEWHKVASYIHWTIWCWSDQQMEWECPTTSSEHQWLYHHVGQGCVHRPDHQGKPPGYHCPQQGQAVIFDITIPVDLNIEEKENDKVTKYKSLKKGYHRYWTWSQGSQVPSKCRWSRFVGLHTSYAK